MVEPLLNNVLSEPLLNNVLSDGRCCLPVRGVRDDKALDLGPDGGIQLRASGVSSTRHHQGSAE